MDPWLENYWGDVHQSLVTYARDEIQDQLYPDLAARMQERVFIEEGNQSRQQFVPDVHVFDTEIPRARVRRQGGAAVAEPIVFRYNDVEITESFVEIRDMRAGGRLVTIIEFVSRANKTGTVGRKKYLDKQRQTLRAAVNLVEIDLLRVGKPVTLVRQLVEEDGFVEAPYHAIVRRHWMDNQLEYYPLPLRAPLPIISIPLRKTDKDVRLNLQSLIDKTYKNGRYSTINYAQSLNPKLSSEDSKWAGELLKSRRKRTG